MIMFNKLTFKKKESLLLTGVGAFVILLLCLLDLFIATKYVVFLGFGIVVFYQMWIIFWLDDIKKGR